MSAPRPLYLLGNPSRGRDAVLGSLGAAEVSFYESAGALMADEAAPPGVVILPQGALPADALLEALLALSRGRGEWTAVLAMEEEGGVVFRAVSVGYAHDAPEVAAHARGENETALLELRRAIAEVSRTRHDINNPLTSGMAETQLLLMDIPEGDELREPLETIQAQLRRIRDLVASLGHLRPRE